jgi:hypothetical protein
MGGSQGEGSLYANPVWSDLVHLSPQVYRHAGMRVHWGVLTSVGMTAEFSQHAPA